MRKFRGVPPRQSPPPAPREYSRGEKVLWRWLSKEDTVTEPVQANGVELRPVHGENGELQLYDIFKGGEWCGSRRTPEQCRKVTESQQSVGTG